jgi:hypothetical protein
MAEAARVGQTPSAREASELAPDAIAHAEKLRRDAEAAYAADDLAGANLLSERAIVAYEHAAVLARLARATARLRTAEAALATSTDEAQRTEADSKRLFAEADDLEMRTKVVRDASPVPVSRPTDGIRDAARMASARSLAVDARLLCASAKLLGAESKELAAAQASVDDLVHLLSIKGRPAPIDEASRARASCLAALTAVRRSAGRESAIGRSDQLLAELSASGDVAPSRDDRGVVVTLHDSVNGSAVASSAEARLKALGHVAAAHPAFPILVTVHDVLPGSAEAAQRQRGDLVAKALVAAGAAADKVAVVLAGSAKPLIDPKLAKEAKRNERIEIVFVDPGG